MGNALVKRDSMDLSAFGEISFGPIQSGIQIYKNAGILPKGMSDGAALAIAVYGFAVHGLSFPMALQNLYSVNGRIAPYTAYIAAKFLEAGHRYRIIKWTGPADLMENGKIAGDNAGCRAEFYRKGESEPTCTTEFTWREALSIHVPTKENRSARLADKTVWKNYGKDMLKNRCLARGIRTTAPEILCGGHTFEEAADLPPEILTPESVIINEVSEPSIKSARIIETPPPNRKPDFACTADGQQVGAVNDEPDEEEQKTDLRKSIESNLGLLSSQFQITAEAATEMYGGPLTRLKTLETLTAAQLFTSALVARLGCGEPYKDMTQNTYMSLVGLRVFQIATAKKTPMEVESGVLLAGAKLNEWEQGFTKGEEIMLWLDDQLEEVRGETKVLPETQF